MLEKVYNLFMGLQVMAMICLILIILTPSVFLHYTNYTVMSGSMEPTIHTGALAFVDETNVDASKIKKGDVIVFKPTAYAIPVTHRVIKVDKKNKTFQTKGDANRTPDPADCSWDSLMGVTKFSIPYLGYVVKYLTTTTGKIRVFGIFCSEFIIWCLIPNKKKKRMAKTHEITKVINTESNEVEK